MPLPTGKFSPERILHFHRKRRGSKRNADATLFGGIVFWSKDPQIFCPLVCQVLLQALQLLFRSAHLLSAHAHPPFLLSALLQILRSQVQVGIVGRLNARMCQQTRHGWQRKLLISNPDSRSRVPQHMRAETNSRLLAQAFDQ